MTSSLIINILIAYGAFQAFLIAFILLRSKNRSLFKKAFATLLIIEGITLFERLLVETDLINSVPHLLGVSYPISFLKPLLMLVMAMAITHKGFKVQRKMYWHLIPFGLILLMNVPFYFMGGAEKLDYVKTFMEKVPSYRSFEFYFSLSFFAYIGIYIFISIQKLNRFREQVINNSLVNWYRIILMVYSGFLLVHLIYFLVQPLAELNFSLVNPISMLAMTFIIQSIVLKLMDGSTLLDTSIPDLGDLDKRKAYEKLIMEQFDKQKVYLDEDLSLNTFARSIKLPSADVSKIINQKFGYSFKKLVARYRVEEAKAQMRSANGSNMKLIDIAYQSGFSNKVSFYRTFKEWEAIAPSEYFEKVKSKENSSK